MSRVSTKAVTYTYLVTDIAPANISGSTDITRNTVIFNKTGVLYVKLGPDCSASDFTYRLNSGAVLELQGWAGPITAVKHSGSDFVNVTETN